MKSDVLQLGAWFGGATVLLGVATIAGLVLSLRAPCNGQLHDAALRGDLDGVRRCLNQGAYIDSHAPDPHIKSPIQGRTALYLAVEHRHADLVTFLLAEGADPNLVAFQDFSAGTPLTAAARNGDAALMNELIAAGATSSPRVGRGADPLSAAVESQCVECVELLLEQHISVHPMESWSTHAIRRAIDLGNVPIIEKLLPHLIETYSQQFAQDTGVSISPIGDAEVRRLAFELASDGPDEVISQLATKDQSGLVSTLLLIHIVGRPGSPLEAAIEFQLVDAFECLLKAGANVEVPGFHSSTPLMTAVGQYRPDIVQSLLSAGASVASRDDSSRTPIHYLGSVFYGSRTESFYADFEQILQLLLDSGATMQAQDSRGETVLHRIARGKSLVECQILLRHGADVNAHDNAGNTPLHACALYGDARIANELIEHGAIINARNNAGATPLDLAVERGRPREFMDLLAIQ